VVASSSVHTSWKARIWVSALRPTKLIFADIHGSMKRRKLKRVKNALEKQLIADTLLNGCKNITAGNNLYFFQLQRLQFGGLHPLPYPPLLRIVSLSTHLMELSLKYASCCGRRLLKAMCAGSNGLQRLSLLNCGVDISWLPTIRRFRQLRRFVLRDDSDCSVYNRITPLALQCFYKECPDLQEVVLDTWALYEQHVLDDLCLQRFSTFQLFVHSAWFQVTEPFPNLRRMVVSHGTIFQPEDQFSELTELHIHNMVGYLPQLRLLPNLQVLKLFGGNILSSACDMQLRLPNVLKHLHSLTLVGFLDTNKVAIREWLSVPGLLGRLKRLTVLPYSDWRNAEDLDGTMTHLLELGESQLSELCVYSSDIADSAICKRFHSILYYDNARNSQQRSRLFLD